MGKTNSSGRIRCASCGRRRRCLSLDGAWLCRSCFDARLWAPWFPAHTAEADAAIDSFLAELEEPPRG